MLVIKPQQMEIFARSGMARFEQQLIAHLWRVWPRECHLTGSDDALLHTVRRMIAAAKAHGYTTSRELTLYAMLVVSLGMGFDTDPQLDWAASSLTSEAIDEPTERIEALYNETIDYLGAIGGEDSGRVVRALLRVRRYDFDTAPATSGDQQIEDLCDLLERFWPEKIAFQEVTPTLEMIGASIAKAGRYGIGNPMGVCVFTTMSFILGHDFDTDPWHPWAEAVLIDPEIGDEVTRSKALLRVGLDRVANSLMRDVGGRRGG